MPVKKLPCARSPNISATKMAICTKWPLRKMAAPAKNCRPRTNKVFGLGVGLELPAEAGKGRLNKNTGKGNKPSGGR